MSLLNLDDDAPEGIPQVPIRIEPKPYRGVTVDTKYTPSSALLTWVEGSNWRVDYYSQVLDADSEPMPQSLNKEPIYQQYRLIKGMDLKVTTPIGFTTDPRIRTFEVRGNATTYPFLVPNYGDMFIADIGDGRAGVFTVTEPPSRQTILKDSVYTIEYQLVTEVEAEVLGDLKRKTIETYHYSRQSLVTGCGPFVTEQELDRHQRYAALRGELLSRYLTDFYSNEHSTLLVPDQLRKTYDHFVVRAFTQLVDPTEDNRVRRVRELNVTADSVMAQPTVWDALVRLDTPRLYGATQRAQLLSTRCFTGRPTLQALGYLGIPRLVFPSDAPTDVDAQYAGRDTDSRVGTEFLEGRPRRPQGGPHLTQAERNLVFFQATPAMDGIEAWELPADIHPVVHDDHYVFSEAFYTEAINGQSKLELLVWQALRRETLNTEALDRLLERAFDWDNLERFYYYPVLWVLLTLASRIR